MIHLATIVWFILLVVSMAIDNPWACLFGVVNFVWWIWSLWPLVETNGH